QGKDLAVLVSELLLWAQEVSGPGPWAHILNVLVILTAVFLILLVLIQRGKGGGLAGAFGGAGGSRALRSRARDPFPHIPPNTALGTAAVFVLLIMLMVKIIPQPHAGGTPSSSAPQAPVPTAPGPENPGS